MTTAALKSDHRAMPAKLPPKGASQHRAAFARRLTAARVSAGFETMRDFASHIGVLEARYRRWEAAETEPDLFHLARIAEATGVSLDILIAGHRRNHAA